MTALCLGLMVCLLMVLKIVGFEFHDVRIAVTGAVMVLVQKKYINGQAAFQLQKHDGAFLIDYFILTLSPPSRYSKK